MSIYLATHSCLIQILFLPLSHFEPLAQQNFLAIKYIFYILRANSRV